MKKLTVFIMVLMLFCLDITCNAQELTPDGIYGEQYNASGADGLSDCLPNDVKEYMDSIDISGFDTSWTSELTLQNIFQQIAGFIKSGGKRPITAGCSILAVLLFGAAAGGLTENKSLDFVLTVGITASAVMPAISTVISCVSAIETVGTFMLSFIPVYAAILISRGRTLTAAGYSTVMLVAAEAVTTACSLVITPLTGMQLGLSVSSSVLTEINVTSIGRTIKRASTWILSLSTTVMLAILGIQTLVNGSADSVTDKTAKFFVGTTVPVVGSAVGEALSTVKGCLKLLGSSVAVYGIVAIAMIMLPVVVELLMWRVVLLLTAMVSEVLGREKSATLIRSVDSCVAFVLGIIIFIGVLFIISVTVVSLV